MYDITISIVTFEKADYLDQTIASCLNTDLDVKIYVIDNSSNDNIRAYCNDQRIQYLLTECNLGYGAANNIAMNIVNNKSKYHLVLNPDVYFEPGTLESIYNLMEEDRSIGLVMPAICNIDGSMQYLCKLLPNPLDLFLRRFLPFFFLNKERNRNFEMRFSGYNTLMDVSFLSGCFMFLRTSIFKDVGYFDERFFLYMEDLDYSRRIQRSYRSVYFPESKIYHKNNRNSYNSLIHLYYHVLSAIKYFNKWGWFFDKERRKTNQEIINQFKKHGHFNTM